MECIKFSNLLATSINNFKMEIRYWDGKIERAISAYN